MMSSRPMMAWIATGTMTAQGAHLWTKPPAQFFDLVAACALRVHRQLEISPKGWDETHGQIHGVSEFIR